MNIQKLGLLGFLACALLFSATVTVACTTAPEKAPVANLPRLENGLADGKLTLTHKIDNGRLTLTTEYSTAYDTAHWRITDSKTLNITARVKPDESVENYKVLVEHVHIDIALKSTSPSLDGWKQDTADFKLHTGSEAGVAVSESYPYENIFAIEGFSQTLIDGWVFFFGSYGGATVLQKRLTEDNLVKYGEVYGNKVQVVWFLLVKYPNENSYHAANAVDEFLIPVATPTPPAS